MAWVGKLIGGFLGLSMRNPFFVVLGILIGHQIDKSFEVEMQNGPAQNRIQAAFFTATFSVMGFLAKADGRVSENEIEYARQIMFRLGLNEEMRRKAMELFSKGKQKDFNIDQVLIDFRNACGKRRSLLQMFVEIQMDAAYVDGPLSSHERQALIKICTALGFSPAQYAHFEEVFQARQRFYSQGAQNQQRQQGHQRSQSNASSKNSLEDAYAILEVSPQVGDHDLKRAYRKLMSKNHPDKLVSKGLPEAMIKLANRKTQEIKEAYDRVRDARGIK